MVGKDAPPDEKLAEFRKLLAKAEDRGVDAYIIPTEDPHMVGWPSNKTYSTINSSSSKNLTNCSAPSCRVACSLILDNIKGTLLKMVFSAWQIL